VSNPILIVDDEAPEAECLAVILRSSGIANVVTCSDARQVMGLVQSGDPEVILLDLAMPHVPGEKLLSQIHDGFPHIPVIVVTAVNEVGAAVRCMKAGAFDYMVKAIEESRLVSGVRRAMEIRRLQRDYRSLRGKMLAPTLQDPGAFSAIVTRNRGMQSLFLLVESLAASSEPILITGETGTGKRLIAQAIHATSGREGPLVDVNVAGLDDGMFSDTLFGHRKGAYTGAAEVRGGLIRRAGRGTLLLDEIGDLAISSQVKLLHLMDVMEYYPLGSDLPERAETRILVSTNRDLGALVTEEKFRRDLFYRLSTHEIRVPPLRDRKDDLPVLVDHFLEEAARKMGKEKLDVPPGLIALLETYPFPGNVRELRSLVIDAATRKPAGPLSLAPFKAAIGREIPSAPQKGQSAAFDSLSTLPTIKQATWMLVEEAMKRAGGNQRAAARLLGISHQALSARLQHGRE
jgi:two-component system, NtrC family, nitrogen regulation response regulator GlnG